MVPVLSKSIEQFGSGVKRIDSLCKDTGIRYSYERSNNDFKFIIYRPQTISDSANVTYDVTYGNALNITEQGLLSPENATKQANMSVSEFGKQAALLPV